MRLPDTFIDPELSEKMLNLPLGEKIEFAKSFYNFDFSTPEGVISFLELLPILDVDVVKQAAAELFPGSVDDSFEPKRYRMEIKAYLMDTLYSGMLADEDAEAQAAEQATLEVQASQVEEATQDAEQVEPPVEEGDEAAPGEEQEEEAPVDE